MDLPKLFGSKCRVKILERFIICQVLSGNPSGFFIRELCRDTGEQINSVRRELINLENLGILKSHEEETKKVYTFNRQCRITEELSGLFLKSYNPMERIEDYLNRKKTVEMVSYDEHLRRIDVVTSNGIVDILIIGRIDKEEFGTLLEKVFFGRNVKYAVMTRETLLERIGYGDKLIISLLSRRDTVIVKDRIDIRSIIAGKA